MEPSEKVKKYWVEKCCECDETLKFIFVNPSGHGMGTMVYNLRAKEKVCVEVYVNNCRNITPCEYVTYRMLGYIDG